jgi:hypothetical protein
MAVSGRVDEEASTTGSKPELSIAPLTLPGVGKICYDLRVTDGATKNDPNVWSKGTPGVVDVSTLFQSRRWNSALPSGNIVYHYIDGALDGTSSWSLTDVNAAGNFGGFVGRGDHSSLSNSEINADYSKVALYKGHALSSSEVAAHYALLKARYGL